jgi:hypothetical protein
MDSAEKKKRRERFFLDRFLERQGITPTVILPREAPDFLIDLEGRTVGIEVTYLFRSNKTVAHPEPAEDPLLQKIESYTDRIVSEAQRIYSDAGNPPVLSTIVFSNRITLDKNKGDQIARLIAHQIQSMSLQNSQVVNWSSRADENEEHPLSESVAFIHARGVPERRFARWSVARAGFIATLTPKHLQDSIDEKATKINAYKEHAKEIWLLIVADRTRPAQKFSVTPTFPLNSISSPFAKTYYYGYAAEEVIEFPRNEMKPLD